MREFSKIQSLNFQKEISISTSGLIFYGLPMTAGGMMSFLVGNYLMKYSTDILLIAPGIMGIIFFISRLWDALNDPICGYLSDHTQRKGERRKAWIRYSIVPVVIFFYMLWNLPGFLSDNGKALWMGVSVIIFFTALTALYVPHYSLGAELSSEYHQRNRIFGFRALAENIGNFLGVGVMTALTLAPKPREQASWLFFLICIFSIALTYLMLAKVKERGTNEFKAKSKIFSSFKDVFKNRHARIILAVGFASQLGAAIIMGMTLYYAEYVILKPEMASLFIGVFMAAATVSIPLWLFISKKIGKKSLWISAKLILGFGFIQTYLLKKGDHNHLLALCLILGMAAGCVLILHPSMLADTIDYDESESGERKEGVYFSVFTFINKSAMGVSGVLIGALLQFSGFKPNVSQTETVKQAMSALYAFGPGICFLLGALVLTSYKLDEKTHKALRAKIDKNL